MSGYLLVRVNGDRYGLPIRQVVEVVDDTESEPIPGAQPAVRGIANVRGRMLPVVHLGALLTSGAPPDRRSHTVVVARVLERVVAFEVDDADAVVREAPLPAPPGSHLSWASGVASHSEELIPILNMDALGEMLAAVWDDGTS